MKTINRKVKPWIRPWNITKFTDLYNRDERFFSVLLKGTMSYLNNHIKMYDKTINHFVYNTGSSYMYVESNGYEFSWNETSGEDMMYMQLPRCVIEMSNIDIPLEELSQPFARGNYEHKEDDQIKGFNAEIKRLPIELTLDLHYVFSNFNEGIVVIQELFDEFIFQRYFDIVYLGQIVQCSIEFPPSYNIELNKIDLAAPEQNVRNLNVQVKICSNYPIVNSKTEISNAQIISRFSGFINQRPRGADVEFTIDGVKSNVDDIYINLVTYDLNEDGQITDVELDIIKEFITNFDIDGDMQVTTYDINVITESFHNNVYNINYDILNKGKVDLENLLIIQKLFKTLDLNNDNIVNQEEIDKIVDMIYVFQTFDINGDLKIDYEDVNSIIQYVLEYSGTKYVDLITNIKKYVATTFNTEFREYILDFINNDINHILSINNSISNFKSAIEYYIKEHNYDILLDSFLRDYIETHPEYNSDNTDNNDNSNNTNNNNNNDNIDNESTDDKPIDIEVIKKVVKEVIEELYDKIYVLYKFKIYDFNNDNIIDENDIIAAMNTLNKYMDHELKYYASTNIIIHSADHTLSNSSITDIV